MSHPLYRLWTEAEQEYLRTHYGEQSASQMAQHLKRSTGSVECRLKSLGLTKPHRRRVLTFAAADRTERLACDPTREQIQDAVNAIRAGLGLEPCVWPVTPDAETQTQFDWRETA